VTLFAVALWCAVATGPAVPAGAQEGDVVEVSGVPYEVHGGKLYTLDDPALEDSRTTITVTGSNVDKSKKRVVHADIVTSEEIAETGAHTLADVLADQAGIQVNSSFGLAQDVTLDGLDGRQVLVLIDGKPVKGRIDARVDVSRIPVSASSIERIEIVRGPMSALYGSEAIGGVINIVTKKASQALGGEVEGGGEIVDGAVWENAGLHGRGGTGPVAARVDVNAASLPSIDRNHDGKDDLPDRRQASAHGEVAMPLASAISYQAQLDASSSQSVARTSSGVPFSERDRTDDVSVSSTLDADVPGGAEPGDVSVDLRIDRVHHVFDELPKGGASVPPSFCSNGGAVFDPPCPAKPQLNSDAVENEARLEAKWTDTWLENLA
jgi:outer membrane receptor protein involved in Fe transport